MRWLERFFIRIFEAATRPLRRRRWSRQWQEDLYSSGADKDKLLGPVREEGGGHNRTVHVIGPLASSDGVNWDEDEVKYMEGKKVLTTVKYYDVRRCDCGAVLSYKNHPMGTCMTCSRVVCKQEGCAARCERCGALVCVRHSVRMSEHTFCSRHRISGYWLAFWGLLK